MISHYPKFTKLDLSCGQFVNEITSNYDPYSDFNFTSLYAWNVTDDAELSIMNDNLILRFPDYETSVPILSVLGNSNIDATLDELLSQPYEIKLVPETTVLSIQNRAKYECMEDLSNHDYVFDLDQIANLSGGKFKKKRNKLSAFMKTYGESLSFNEVAMSDPLKRKSLQSVFDEWDNRRMQITEDSDVERRAFDRLLDQADKFDLKCYEVLIDDEIAGFSINEILPHGYSITHFQKALLHHNNLEIFINTMVAKNLLNAGSRYINWEQDMGVEGLRQSKLSYYPTKYLKKYSVNRAS